MSNSKITELQYGDFSLDFHQKMGQKRIPIVGQMERESKSVTERRGWFMLNRERLDYREGWWVSPEQC